ncbi:flagellar biosynthesis regulatory protein FlaF [Henriciella barbarensis]|uniref:Flagellar biosynthesis regulatory protein FlaF n=2 Tax=Henriciella TaxID=453849 RepID=A0A399R1F9_9PROT|nr:flagellar biosynthesis regulator FlaF [Henriciella barbarensis]MCH2458340.1 flagellar biosynthesis regulator FlaF [Henriciella sp.]MCZ4297440.1 flagellar biosynthesis regulator FlaF [Henriciella marina]RIJ23697.1 flagellar biosynthesis regulatory protein FlaF [Henriciella barbarensis]
MHNLAHKAYSTVTSRTASDKQIELALFSEITNALKDVAAQDVPLPAVWADAIDRNLQLWHILSVDLVSPENGLDDSLRTNLLTLAEMVRRVSYQVLAGDTDISDLVEINETIMKGLSGEVGPSQMETTT